MMWLTVGFTLSLEKRVIVAVCCMGHITYGAYNLKSEGAIVSLCSMSPSVRGAMTTCTQASHDEGLCQNLHDAPVFGRRKNLTLLFLGTGCLCIMAIVQSGEKHR
jgi:hypothetical protein